MSDTDTLELRPIGVIHTPFKVQEGTPIQPVYAEKAEGTVEIYEPYRASLADLDGFERIWLVYWFDRAKGYQPKVVPYRDTVPRGLFATRAPCRPNPIGLSPVRLLSVDVSRGILRVASSDILDRTPLLDIKPYVPSFESFPATAAGWIDRLAVEREKADRRFEEDS
jgi:tRNA-Thr(GGU) m(6)t(6)A37 methyltransferase TsaA